jgi:histidyl-tRNA synthetase
MLFTSPRGTKDVLPQESQLWQRIEEKARAVFSLFAFQEIRTPIFEESKLFSRTLGELTDIVQKQMFLIKRETDCFVLRPEATASIIRSYVENTLYNFNAVSKFYYIGPMFRAERPQKGRLRQFHHIGCEAIGSYQPYLDGELIYLATRILSSLGVSGFQLRLNTIGCLNDKKKYGLALRENLRSRKKSLCHDCQNRVTKNVFRVLDCKNKQCRDIVLSLKLGDAYLCEECRTHFQKVKESLDLLGVQYNVDPLLVRGLDYYTRTVFEITHHKLGAQDALGAGGRYDGLVEELGGPSRGAVGFALGVERLLLARDETAEPQGQDSLDCYIVPLGEAALKKSVEIAKSLREALISADLDYLQGSLKAKLRRADKKGVRFCVILGDDELARGKCALKDMRQGSQEEVALADLIKEIKNKKC